MDSIVHKITMKAQEKLAIRENKRVRIIKYIHGYQYFDTSVSNKTEIYGKNFLGTYSIWTNKYLNF